MSHNVTDLTPKQRQAIDLYITGKGTGDIVEALECELKKSRGSNLLQRHCHYT